MGCSRRRTRRSAGRSTDPGHRRAGVWGMDPGMPGSCLGPTYPPSTRQIALKRQHRGGGGGGATGRAGCGEGKGGGSKSARMVGQHWWLSVSSVQVSPPLLEALVYPGHMHTRRYKAAVRGRARREEGTGRVRTVLVGEGPEVGPEPWLKFLFRCKFLSSKTLFSLSTCMVDLQKTSIRPISSVTQMHGGDEG
jgi:hypothetical protein